MSTWDIVDVVGVNEEVVSTKRKKAPFRAFVTSAAHIAVVVTLAFGSTSPVMIQRGEHASTRGASFKFLDAIRPDEKPSPPARRRIVGESDTQYGQSTMKLAQLFETYFLPAENEEPFDDEYSFS